MYFNNKSYHEYCNANQIKTKENKRKQKTLFLLIRQPSLNICQAFPH